MRNGRFVVPILDTENQPNTNFEECEKFDRGSGVRHSNDKCITHTDSFLARFISNSGSDQ